MSNHDRWIDNYSDGFFNENMWFSVKEKEKLPLIGEMVLVCQVENGKVIIYTRYAEHLGIGIFFLIDFEGYTTDKITHWMYPPSPPTK